MGGVFPVCTGMSLEPPRLYISQERIPRMHGDEPVQAHVLKEAEEYSPYARG